MALISRIGFALVKWKSRHGLRRAVSSSDDAKKHETLQFGVRGETHAYWHLRRLGYIFIARNYAPSGVKGEIGLSDLMETRWSSSRYALVPKRKASPLCPN